MISRIVVLISLILTIAACGNGNNDENTALSGSELYDIRDNLKLWELAEKQNNLDPEFKLKISQSILKKIIVIKNLDPDVSKLNGEGLEALCLLSGGIGETILGNAGHPDLEKIADTYLSSIKEPVLNEISELQKTMKGSGCYISPEPE